MYLHVHVAYCCSLLCVRFPRAEPKEVYLYMISTRVTVDTFMWNTVANIYACSSVDPALYSSPHCTCIGIAVRCDEDTSKEFKIPVDDFILPPKGE